MAQEAMTPDRTIRQRVLIKTQPLGANYGGVLQAFALQSVVRQLGFDPETQGVGSAESRKRLGRPLTLLLKVVRAIARGELASRVFAKEINSELQSFVENHLVTVGSVSKRYDALIVGSDQVWRPKYSDVADCLFESIPPDFDGPRISYAASFGVDHGAEFDHELVSRTRPLVKVFNAVSVRESSGIALVKQLWKRADAIRNVDPTMLLEPAEYLDIMGTKSADTSPSQRQSLVTYLLDPTDAAMVAVMRLEHAMGVRAESIMAPQPQSVLSYLRAKSDFKKISVDDWLRGLRNAEFVVTDSFHGCVLSILFEREFVVFPNPERGEARVRELLETFGLGSRLVLDDSSTGVERVEGVLNEPIDWEPVRQRLVVERERGLRFLEVAMAGAWPGQPPEGEINLADRDAHLR